MKNLVLSLLVLVILLPGLACADIMRHASAKGHCHSMNHKVPPEGVKLFKDCARIDLQKTDTSVLKKPVFEKQVFFVNAPAVTPLSVRYHDVRTTGPPVKRLTSDVTHPSVLLISPRLRI